LRSLIQPKESRTEAVRLSLFLLKLLLEQIPLTFEHSLRAEISGSRAA
jgi:hypothetical protein